MRNIMQLVGGVVVAGAVAAGSTAFTGAGFTKLTAADLLIGGSITQTVHGAVLKGLTVTQDGANPDRITAVAVTLKTDGGADLGATDVVTASFTGTPGGTPVVGACTQAGAVWTCTVTGGYYTNVTGITVNVSPVVIP